MKENFTTKLIKRAYGITGPLDEYKQREVDRIGNICFIFLLIFVCVVSLLSFLLAKHHAQLVAYILPLVLLLFSFGLLIYISTQVAISEVDHFDKEELTDSDQQLYQSSSWKNGIVAGFWMYGVGVIGDMFDLNGTILTRASHPKSIFFGLFCGLLFTLLAKFLAWYKKKVDDDKS